MVCQVSRVAWLVLDWDVLDVRLDAGSSSEFAIEYSNALPRRIMGDDEHCPIGAGIGIAGHEDLSST
jgi:hypothetical protein